MNLVPRPFWCMGVKFLKINYKLTTNYVHVLTKDSFSPLLGTNEFNQVRLSHEDNRSVYK